MLHRPDVSRRPSRVAVAERQFDRIQSQKINARRSDGRRGSRTSDAPINQQDKLCKDQRPCSLPHRFNFARS